MTDANTSCLIAGMISGCSCSCKIQGSLFVHHMAQQLNNRKKTGFIDDRCFQVAIKSSGGVNYISRSLFNRCWFGYMLKVEMLTVDPQLLFLNLDYVHY